MATINKQVVKNYLDDENISEKLKDSLTYSDDWSDIKSSLADLITKYANNPTQENKRMIDDLVSANFIGNTITAMEAIESIYVLLGINEKINNRFRI